MNEAQISKLLAYKNDPWLFLCECVFTKDQVDQKNPVKPFPQFPYLELYVKMWQRYRLIAVPKSRRLTMSWTNIALYLHAAMFNSTQDFAFVSKKEDDAAELVKRAEFIFDHIPESKIPRSLLPKKETKAKPAALIFPELDSKIQGFPMGADQLRQFTFSGILGDECAFWEEAQKFYSSAVPTVEGGGRMSLISSRHPGFFQRLVYDQLDHDGEIDETCTAKQMRPFGDDSVIVWINEKNSFCIIDIHYTAHPGKREATFKEGMKAKMPIKDFMVEYERNWEAFEGRPVFEDYNRMRHETPHPQEPEVGLPLLLGWDFGMTPSAIVAQLRGQTLHIIREYTAERASINQFAPYVMRDLKQRYPGWCLPQKDFIHYIDPAGLDANQTDARSCADVMRSHGIRNIFPGPMTWEPRRRAVEHFLLHHDKNGAGLQLHAQDCPVLSKGFLGGYRYPDKYSVIEPGKPSAIKNKFSHPHDALQYLCGGALLLVNKKATVTVNTPEYSFSRNSAQTGKKPSRKDEGYNFG